MSKLILIRGLPGSGKSTMAKALGIYHFETDQYFMVDGMYKFDAEKLNEAHGACLHHTRIAMSARVDIVVSNTFTQLWELQPYLDIAHSKSYEVEIITATGNFGSVHGVPDAAIEAMRNRWEDV
jgi:predicted kinase